VDRSCEVCGKALTSTRKDARYCSSSCRGKAVAKRRLAAQAAEVVVPISPAAPPAETSGLRATVAEQLRKVKRLDTVAGQQALLLADRLEHSTLDNGSAVAALSKELDRLTAALLSDLREEPDALDDAQGQVLEFRTARRHG
jgi:hypothetical protein